VTSYPIRVVIADDHPIYREGLARLLGDIGGFEIVGLAGDGEQAVSLAVEAEPDVVVMDLRMPVLDGIEATRRITTGNPDIGVVVLSMFDEDSLVFAAIRAGPAATSSKTTTTTRSRGSFAALDEGRPSSAHEPRSGCSIC
jgi:DNA-binding NarL/FixJ family response regulator